MNKVTKVLGDCIWFDDSIKLYSDHNPDCCENHYLSFSDLSLEDFEGLEFDLANDNFFKKINGYGIELLPLKGHSIKIPGYGSNNGYYSSNLSLVLEGVYINKIYDITECQDY